MTLFRSEARRGANLITDASIPYQDELAIRKRRYAIMMVTRLPLIVLAALFYDTTWLAVTLLALSVPLPWMAVLVANDRLPKKGTSSMAVPHRHRRRG